MSFAKARLQRFNDIKDCSPSPAKYNVADVQNKWIRGGFFTKSGRFTKKDSSPPASDNESVKSTPCFQTPKPIPKKKKSLSRSFTKTGSFSRSSSSSEKSNDKEQLQEKIVECSNKDAYIKELLEQIEELKINYNRIEQEKDRTNIENQLLNDEIKQLKLNCNQYLNDIEVKSIENRNISEELTQIRSDYKELKQKNHDDMAQLLENIKKFETLYKQTIEESKNMLEVKKTEYEENLKKIENQYKASLERIEEIENRKREEIDNYQQIINDKETKITQLETKCGEINVLEQNLEELKKLLSEKDAKILLQEENFRDINFLAEIQAKEKLDELEQIWQIRFNDLQKQYDLLLKQYEDSNKIQEELKSKLITHQQNYQELTNKYENLKHDQDINQQKNDDLLIQIRKYEITTKTNLDTIDVLKKRLIASDRDVEQFKDELTNCETKFVNYENLIINLRRQLQEYQIERDELEMQYESTLKTTQDQIETMKTTLLKKVDDYDRIVKEHLDRNEQQQRQFNEIYQHLHEQQYQNQQSQVLIERAKELIQNYEEDIDRLSGKNNELIALINSDENKIVLYENEIDENQEIRRKYIEISGKYDEILQNYEQLQQQFKDLEIEKNALNDEYQQLDKKYIDIVSHQNNKQKIKHIGNLKSDAGELFQHNVDLRKENNRLQKIIERLHRDLNDLKRPMKKNKNGTDKENVSSPNCLATRTDSPGPLKEVN